MLNRLLARWLEFAVLAALLTVVMVSAVDDVEFHGDEASRIASSYFFETFTDGHLNSPLWDENYWTLTQPPLSRYFIGLGRSAAGYGPEDLNNTWNWYRDVERNIKEGNMPSPGLLWWSRLPMALLTVVSGLALFYLLAAAAGRVAGLHSRVTEHSPVVREEPVDSARKGQVGRVGDRHSSCSESLGMGDPRSASRRVRGR